MPTDEKRDWNALETERDAWKKRAEQAEAKIVELRERLQEITEQIS